jgi:capsular polysaccharide export protein
MLLLGEQRSHHKVAIAAAKERGVNVFVTDFGYIRPDWVIIERDGMNALSHFPRNPAAILEQAKHLPPVAREVQYRDSFFNQALWDMTFHFSQVDWPFRFPYYRRHTLVNPYRVYPGVGWRLLMAWRHRRDAAHAIARLASGNAAFYVFAMQTEDDFSIRAYSSFDSMMTPIEATIRSFARAADKKSNLLIKLHPLDPGLKPWKRLIDRIAQQNGVANRIAFIDGGDLDELLRRSRGLITVNSTVGVRAIELGCPVLALGEAVYRIAGLTFEESLDRFWNEAAPPEPELADAFMRLIAATLHVRGAMYCADGIEAAAEGMAYRMLNGVVNVPIPSVNRGERLRLDTRG